MLYSDKFYNKFFQFLFLFCSSTPLTPSSSLFFDMYLSILTLMYPCIYIFTYPTIFIFMYPCTLVSLRVALLAPELSYN